VSPLRTDATSHQSGFTLLEVVVAFAILAVSLGVVFQAFGTGSKNLRLSEQHTIATLIAESQLATIGVEHPLKAGIVSGKAMPPYRWRAQITPIGGGEAIGNRAVPVLYDVVMTVQWKDGDADRSMSLTTQRLGLAGPR